MGTIRNIGTGIAGILFLLTLSFSSAFAQKDGKEDFGAAVDMMNCETIKFILLEDNKKDIVKKMECLTFESIFKSIPEDQANTTGRLCKEINNLKARYNAKEDLGKQLDNTITFIYGRVTKKKRKGDVEEYKNKLEEYKKEALESYNQTSAAAAKPEPKKKEPTATAETPRTDSPKANATPPKPTDEIMPADKPKSEGGSNIIGWSGVILGLLSLILAVFALMRLKHFMDETEARRDEPAPELTRPSAPLVRESPDNYKLLEMKFNDELRNMRTYFEAKIAELSAAPKAAAPKAEEQFAASTVIEEGHYVPDHSMLPNEDEEQEEASAPENEEHSFSPPVQVSLFGDLPSGESQTKGFDEDLDTNLLPSYRFAALPGDGGTFDEAQFAENAAADSIFEIESYADVPGRAFFSILNYPEVAAKVIADPATYLEPFCLYEDSPVGKSRIVLLDEGILQLDNGRWVVTTKAHVKFE